MAAVGTLGVEGLLGGEGAILATAQHAGAVALAREVEREVCRPAGDCVVRGSCGRGGMHASERSRRYTAISALMFFASISSPGPLAITSPRDITAYSWARRLAKS